MVENPDADGYTKTPNHLKMFRKPQITTTYWKAKNTKNWNTS